MTDILCALVFLLSGGLALLSPLLGWKYRINLSWIGNGFVTALIMAGAFLLTSNAYLSNDQAISEISLAAGMVSMGLMTIAIALQGRAIASYLALALLSSSCVLVSGLIHQEVTGFPLTVVQWTFALLTGTVFLDGFKGKKPFLIALGFPFSVFSLGLLVSPLPLEHWSYGFLLTTAYLLAVGLEMGRQVAISAPSHQEPIVIGRVTIFLLLAHLVGGYYLITDSFGEVTEIQSSSKQTVCVSHEPQGHDECKTLSLSRKVIRQRTLPSVPHPIRGFSTPERPQVSIEDPSSNRTITVVSESISVYQPGQGYSTFYFDDSIHDQILKEFRSSIQPKESGHD